MTNAFIRRAAQSGCCRGLWALPVALTGVIAACGGGSETTPGSGGGGLVHQGGGPVHQGGGGQNERGAGGHGVEHAGGGGAAVSSSGGLGGSGGGAGGTGVGGGGAGGGSGGSGGHVDLMPPKAGIPDCAAMFIDPDAVCRPALAKCAPGQIPKMDVGCVPVGIAECAPVFLGADGMCHASMDACAPDQFAVPSEGCVPIDGAGCGADPFGLVVDQAGDQHVDPSYTGGASDGSRAAPWTTIATALAHTAPGARVVLAAGTYPEPIAPTQSVTVIGRCPSMVTVSGTTGTTPAIVQVTTAVGAVTLEGLTLTGNGEGVHADGGTVHLDGVVIRGAKTTGLDLANGAAATLHHVLVQATQTTTMTTGGSAIDAGNSAVTIAQSAFVDLHGHGVQASGGPGLTIQDSLFQRIAHLPGPQSQKGDAVSAQYLAIQMSDVAVTQADEFPLGIQDVSACTVSDSFFEVPATQFASGGIFLNVSSTPPLPVSLTVDGLVIAGGQSYGIYVQGTGAVVSRTLVRDVVGDGGAFHAQDSDGKAKLVVTDSAATHNGVALSLGSLQRTSSLTRVVFDSNADVSDTTRSPSLYLGGLAKLDRVAVLSSTLAGGFFSSSSAVTFTNSIISATSPGVSGALAGKNGVGLIIDDNSGSVALDSVRIESSHAAGLFVSHSNATLTNVLVTGVAQGSLLEELSFTSVDNVAYGIAIDQGLATSVSMSGMWITGAAGASILFDHTAGTIHSTHAEGGLYGLAVQGTPVPTYGSDDELTGSTQNVLTNGMLPLP